VLYWLFSRVLLFKNRNPFVMVFSGVWLLKNTPTITSQTHLVSPENLKIHPGLYMSRPPSDTPSSTLLSFPVSVSYKNPITLVSALTHGCFLKNSTSSLTLCGTLRTISKNLQFVKTCHVLRETIVVDIEFRQLVFRSCAQLRANMCVGCKREAAI
jgi:hypothetical protein